MNNKEIIFRLNAVIGALNNVTVREEVNLNNLGGSIRILRELRDQLTNEDNEKADTFGE